MNFGELFRQGRSAEIQHQGRTIMLLDRVPAKLGEKFVVTLERTASPYVQGVGMSEGVEVFGERQMTRSKLPFSFEVTCRNKAGYLSFYNMAEVQGRQEWWHAGSCMMAQDIPDGRRYHCNDIELDDDFDDLVFSVVRLQRDERAARRADDANDRAGEGH